MLEYPLLAGLLCFAVSKELGDGAGSGVLWRRALVGAALVALLGPGVAARRAALPDGLTLVRWLALAFAPLYLAASQLFLSGNYKPQ